MNVLVISPVREDHERSYAAASEPGWSVLCVRNLREARTALRISDVDIVVLADSDSADGPSWYEVVGEIEDMLGFQPVIVASRAADGRLWEEVLTRACHDLLPQMLYLKQMLQMPVMAGQGVAVPRYQACAVQSRSECAGQRPAAQAAASVANAVRDSPSAFSTPNWPRQI